MNEKYYDIKEYGYDWNKINRIYFDKQKNIITKQDILEQYSEEQLLDMIDFDKIQNYIRKKKLENIKR